MPESGIPSKLRQTAMGPGGPVRGVGAGFAKNQQLAGVQDPEAAARLAGMSPSDMEEQESTASKVMEETEGKREELAYALKEGTWKPAGDLPSTTDWEKLLAKQPPDVITRWHREMKEQLEEAIEKQDEILLRETLQSSFTIQPEDNEYEPLMDRARRKRIEEGLKPLDFDQMLFQGYVEQDVPIRPNLVVTFRTIYTQHGLWLEYYMATNKELQDMSVQAIRHTFSLLQVAVGLERMNGKVIGADLTKFTKDTQREEFIAAVKARMEFLARMPTILSDDFIVQNVWFQGRVRKLVAGNLVEKVGNS